MVPVNVSLKRVLTLVLNPCIELVFTQITLDCHPSILNMLIKDNIIHTWSLSDAGWPGPVEVSGPS